MPVEFVGVMYHVSPADSTALFRGLPVDRDFLRQQARVHEDAGFNQVLTYTVSVTPDGAQMAAYAATHTDRLTYLISHRPGFRSPTVAARELATLDQISEGRVAIHAISGAADSEMKRDGDYLAKEERYSRADEYLSILKQALTATEPFDYHGEYYQLEGYMPAVRPFEGQQIPISFGGSSDAAYGVGAKQADVYALFGEPLAETAEQIASIRAASEASGRAKPPRMGVSLRVIMDTTDELAWERAHRILDARKPASDHATTANTGASTVRQSNSQKAASAERILAAANKGELHDRALWTAIFQAAGGTGESPALVGTPETVAESLLAYYELGVTWFLIMGYDPCGDAAAFGRELIPRVRSEIRRRDSQTASTVARDGAS